MTNNKELPQGAPSSQASLKNGGLPLVMERNDFYRDGYRKMQTITLVAISAAILSTLVAVGAILTKPEPRYFAINNKGSLIPMVPLHKPMHSSGEVMSWATEAITKTFSFDFVHYRRDLNESREYYTEEGWNALLKAFIDSGLGPSVREQKQVLSATPTGAPAIVGQGEYRGRYVWKVQQPFLLSFYTNKETKTQKVLVNLTVVRVPTTENPRGLGIQQLIMEDTI